PLTEGGTVSKAQVTQWLEDCIANSGHGLVDDFRNLWPYSNRFTKPNYPYATTNNLQYAGEGHKETVFAVKFGTLADWGDTYILGYTNQLNLHSGLRSNNGQANTFPFGQGWGAGPVNSKLWNDWRAAEPNDVRREGSIINADTDLADYIYGAGSQMEETGFWQKKYIAITAFDNGALIPSYAILADGAQADYQLAHTQDLVPIRFAQVLLMHAELTETATNLNRVRARAGLPAINYSLAALKRERRWEWSFEGLRYFDLMRWHASAEALDCPEGVVISDRNVHGLMRSYVAVCPLTDEATGRFWAIPTYQLRVCDEMLTQNKGWGADAHEYTGVEFKSFKQEYFFN